MQSRFMSMVEAVANILMGYGIATVGQVYIFWALNKPISWETSFIVGAFMTIVSLVRSYTLRRIFNRLHQK